MLGVLVKQGQARLGVDSGSLQPPQAAHRAMLRRDFIDAAAHTQAR